MEIRIELIEENFLKAVELLGYSAQQAKEHIEYCKLIYKDYRDTLLHLYDFFTYECPKSYVHADTMKGPMDLIKIYFVKTPYSLTVLKSDLKELEKTRKKVNKGK